MDRPRRSCRHSGLSLHFLGPYRNPAAAAARAPLWSGRSSRNTRPRGHGHAHPTVAAIHQDAAPHHPKNTRPKASLSHPPLLAPWSFKSCPGHQSQSPAQSRGAPGARSRRVRRPPVTTPLRTPRPNRGPPRRSGLPDPKSHGPVEPTVHSSRWRRVSTLTVWVAALSRSSGLFEAPADIGSSSVAPQRRLALGDCAARHSGVLRGQAPPTDLPTRGGTLPSVRTPTTVFPQLW